jgi:hypothetical protein
MKHKIVIFLIVISLTGCAATSAIPEARSIEIVNQQPDRYRCKYLGEVVGSQGNWITGDYTSNKNLIVGARNDLRNEAYRLGANIIYVEDMATTNASESLGTTNVTVIGKAYKCTR